MNTEEPKDIELQGNEISEMVSINVICRLCASQNEKLIGIYSEDGYSNDLANKMNLYLPIKISETDELPLQCCWQCASTVLAWHDLVVTTVDTDRRLRSCQLVTEKQLLADIYQETTTEPNAEVVPDPDNSLTYCQRENVTEEAGEKSQKKLVSAKLADKKNVNISYESRNEIENFNDLNILKNESFEEDLDESNDFENSLCNNFVRIEKEETQEEKHDDDLQPVFEYSCQICTLTYLNENDIMNHLKQCHSSENTNTSASVKKKVQMREKRKHNKIDQELVNSAKVVVDGRVYYNCKICGKSLHSPYTYVWHMRIHSGERPYVCDLCGKQFRVSQGLVRHLKETHAKIKNFPCDLCGRMFATKRNVEEHRRIHTNERPYICDLCGKAFKQKASLFVHNRSHNDTFPYKCSYCNQGFRSKPPLLIHVTRHTGEKPYPCQICGRCFRIKYELKRHMLIHSDYKPFSCNICGMSFRQKRYLRNHNKQNHPQLVLEDEKC